MLTRTRIAQFILLLSIASASQSHADEGMWLFTNPPSTQLKAKYGFEPSEEWLEHLQKSAVRFNNGGSASFISADGLVMTNHHVGSDAVEKLSTPDRNLLDTGFFAKSREEEMKCADLEINVLWAIEDMTARVNAAVKPGMSLAEAGTARRGMMSTIQQEYEQSTGLDCQMVTLYKGERYHLYQYKRFTDVRLVFAPEQDASFFGGDTDNFEYPRYCLDICFFRVYENDAPYKPEHHLTWSPNGSAEGDLVFVAGHPGRTQRINTVEHLKFMRDLEVPQRMQSLWRREVQLQSFTARSAEFARIGNGELFGTQNSRKSYTGILAGLQNPAIMQRKMEDEQNLRAAVNANPEYKKQWGDGWDQVAGALTKYREFFLRNRVGVRSNLVTIATHLVRLSAELPKPNAERLPEYSDASLDSVYLSLYSPQPIYDAIEIDRIASSLAYAAETLGGDDAYTQLALGGMSPKARAESLVTGTTLKDIAARKALAEGGAAAIAASNDPLIRLAASLDPEARKWRKKFEDEIESVQREGYAKIAAAQFAINGESVYPDATFTLRLAYGTVIGYTEGGTEVAPYTTFEGLYERATEREGQAGFDLPKRWWDRKKKLDLDTPYNFVSTADIIGGNSGSPVVNTKGELVGIIFDGNIQSLVLDLAYTDDQARSVSVDSRGIVEALSSVYKADSLVAEIVAP